jgi:hypothetical protein
MAKTAMVRRSQGNGSAGSKIVNVNREMGVKGIGSQQGSTRIIFDAIQLQANPTNGILTLFENCKTRQFPLTNLTENKLQVGESITMQRFSFYIIECTAATTTVLDIVPLSFFAEFNRLYGSWFDFSIAQDTVIKRYPLSAMYSAFNKDSRWNSMYQLQPAAGDLISDEISHDVSWMDNNIVIPPQIEFKCQITVPPIVLPAGFDFYLAMKIEGLGSLFAPKSTY